MDTDLLKIIIALLAPTGTLALVVKMARKYVRRRQRRRIENAYTDTNRVYQEMQELISSLSHANRVLVIRSENGGGVPTPGSIVKNSVAYEICGATSTPCRASWQNVPLDSQYSSVMADICAEGVRDVRLSTLDQNCQLAELFSAFNTTRARMVRLCATDRVVLYLSVHFTRDGSLQGREKVKISKTARTLCNILKRYYHVVKPEGSIHE